MLSRVLTLVFLVAVLRDAPAIAQGASGMDPCEANADVLKDDPFVMVAVPVAGARVKSGFVVTGCSRTFESTVVWTLTIRGGKALAKGTATGGGVDGPGALSFTVAATVTKPTLAYLEVFEPNMAGGAPSSRVIVPVVLTP